MYRIFLFSVVALFFVVSSFFVWQSSVVLLPDETVQSALFVETEPVVEAYEVVTAIPMRLVIPRINVDAFVEPVGITSDGKEEMAVPSSFIDVGWYKHGVRPGMPGSAVITGHLDGKDVEQAVFYDLHTLEIGDEVRITNTQQLEETFYVVKTETYAYDAPTTDVFVSTDGKARLNLITCGGDWLSEEGVYSDRTVVFTEQLAERE